MKGWPGGKSAAPALRRETSSLRAGVWKGTQRPAASTPGLGRGGGTTFSYVPGEMLPKPYLYPSLPGTRGLPTRVSRVLLCPANCSCQHDPSKLREFRLCLQLTPFLEKLEYIIDISCFQFLFSCSLLNPLQSDFFAAITQLKLLWSKHYQ